MAERAVLEVVDVAALDPAERRRHEGVMRRAIAQARRNPQRPFGAVIVDRRTEAVLAEAVNAVDESPLLHGETAAIDACARGHRGLCWPDLALYTTAEPCPMCAAAIAWTGIGEVVVGSSIAALAGFGIRQILLPCADVLRAAPFYRGRLLTGVLAAETDELYRAWARGSAGRSR